MKYKFKDQEWQVRSSKTGKLLGSVTVDADTVRYAHKADPTQKPENVEDDVLQNAGANWLESNKLKHDDVTWHRKT